MSKSVRSDLLLIAEKEKAKRAAELVNVQAEKAELEDELINARKKIASSAAELIIANEEKAKREAELVIANEEKAKHLAQIAIANEEKGKRAAELVIANAQKAKRAAELVIANSEKVKRAAWLVIANLEKAKRADELFIAGKELAYQNEEKIRRAAELIIADVNKTKRESELVIAKIEKAKRIAKSIIADKELSYQTEEKSKRAAELVIADAEKSKRAAELVIANIKKAKRSAELVIANVEKAKRSEELIVVKKELVYQKSERAKRAAELIIANVEKAKRAAELVIANIEKAKRAAESVVINKELVLAREKEKLVDALQKSELKHSALISNISDVIGIVGADGIVKYRSPNIEKWFGWQPQDLIGADGFSNVHPDEQERVKNEFSALLEMENSSITSEYKYRCKDGSYKEIEMTTKNLTHDPVINGVLLNYRDISERKVAELELIKAKEKAEEKERFVSDMVDKFNKSQSIAKIGTFELDIESGKVWWSDELYRIFEVDAGKYIPSVESNAEFVHPDDNEWFHKDVFKSFVTGEQMDCVIRIVTHLGKLKHCRFISEIVFDGNGKPETLIGTFNDITDSIESRNELIKSKSEAEENEVKFHNLFENSPIGKSMSGTDGYLHVNKSFCEIVGYTEEELINKNWSKITFPDDIRKSDEMLQSLINGEAEKVFFEKRYIHKGGKIVWVDISVYLQRDKERKPQFFISTIIDITERKKYEHELIRAKEKAEESERLKSAFLTNMSHEIRTPMNGILGFAELLKEPNLTSDELQDYIQTIQISGARMLNTINGIVDISKIESGLISMDIKETNLNEKIEFTYKFFKPEAESKGLRLIFKTGLLTNEAIINTDNEKVYGILTNLVRNAIKFTYDGSIEFGYVLKSNRKPGSTEQSRSAELEFFVKDTGIGIPQKQQQLIFERFRQGSESFNRDYEGSGLGLSISKSYAEMLGGRIWVESEEGLGSTFYFTIPYTPVSKEKNISENDGSAENNEVQLKNLKILIVEDDEISYSLLSKSIQKISKEILHAITGVEAIEACRNNQDLDLVLMDIRMPQMNGLVATQQIRQFNKDVIIIAQTAYAFTGDSEKALEAGCNGYISKPINRTQLFELIKKYVNK